MAACVGNEPCSHEPCAAMITGAASSLGFRSASMTQTVSVPVWRNTWAFQGCHTSAPAVCAACSRSPSRCSRPSALPRWATAFAGFGIKADRTASLANRPTRRTSGPACRRKSFSTPSSCSSGMLVAEMNSPQTLRRGKLLFSTIATDHPARASKSAAVDPDGPAPMTIASYRMLPIVVNAPRYETVRKEPRRVLMKLPQVWLRPKCRQLAAVEARLDAPDCIVAGDVVASDRPQQMAAEQRHRAAPRLAGDEQGCQWRQLREQWRELRLREVMQEKIGGDDVHLRQPAFHQNAEQISGDRLRTPAKRLEPTARCRLHDVLLIQHGDGHIAPSPRQQHRNTQHERAIAGAQIENGARHPRPGMRQ